MAQPSSSPTQAPSRKATGYVFALIFTVLSILGILAIRVAAVQSGVGERCELIAATTQFQEHPMLLRTQYTGIAAIDRCCPVSRRGVHAGCFWVGSGLLRIYTVFSDVVLSYCVQYGLWRVVGKGMQGLGHGSEFIPGRWNRVSSLNWTDALQYVRLRTILSDGGWSYNHTNLLSFVSFVAP